MIWKCKRLAYICPVKNPAMDNLIFSKDISQAQLASTTKSGKLRFFSGWTELRVSSRFGLDGRK